MLREITSRQNGGITITLLCNFSDITGKAEYGKVIVTGREAFELNELPLDQAGDVYMHPFYYAAKLLTSGKLAERGVTLPPDTFSVAV